jgi:hypothetical protein
MAYIKFVVWSTKIYLSGNDNTADMGDLGGVICDNRFFIHISSPELHPG